MSKTVTALLLFVALLLACAFLFMLYAAWVAEPALQSCTVVADGRSEYAILAENRSSAALASADYLSRSIRERTGIQLPVVFERTDEGKYIVLCSGPADADGEEQTAYSLGVEGGDMIIRALSREDLYAVTRAVCDRWLQEDCGLQEDGALVLDQEMIGGPLLDLPLEIRGQLRILTQNLRYNNDGNGNSIAERAERFLQLVNEYEPDIIGTQEATAAWMDQLREKLGERYVICGVSREGPDETLGEWNAVLFKRDRFTQVDGDTFWLSGTPLRPCTMLDYDGRYRICTWVLLQDRETQKTFLVSNTHLQNGSSSYLQQIRRRQLQILLEQLKSGEDYLDAYPGFLIGDFNAEAHEDFYALATAVYHDAELSSVNDFSHVHYTFHNYGRSEKHTDYCFHSPENTTVLAYKVLDDQYGGYVSDHYGVLITAIIN